MGGLVGRVEVRAGIDDVGSPLRLPAAGCRHSEKWGSEERCALNHGSVDGLPSCGSGDLEQRRADSERQQHASAAVVAEEVEWWYRRAPCDANGVERAGDRDVVEVV